MRRISLLLPCTLLLQFGCAANTQQPAPIPGPGPISPSTKIQTPPTVSPSADKGIEAPLGMLDEDEEPKRKGGEITVSPPGTVQEDPAARQRRDKPSSSEEK